MDNTPGLPDHEHVFWDYLKGAGYDTAAFGKIHMYPERNFDKANLTKGKGSRWTQAEGLPIGSAPLGEQYKAWLEEKHPGGYEKIYQQRRDPEYKENRTAIENVLPVDQYVDYWIAQNTVDYIEQRETDRPFFIWCGFCGPHGPFDPPKPYSTMYSPDDMPLPLGYEKLSTAKRIQGDKLRRISAYYYGLVTLIDHMVGTITDALKNKEIYENTVVIYTSDHGEMLGDFGRFGKANFYDTVTHMPLIVKPASGYPVNSRVKGLTEHIDIAPTILDFAGLDIPDCMEGISLLKAMESGFSEKEAVLCEHTLNDQSRHGVCIRNQDYKMWYWTNPDEYALFDLGKDPDETCNLAEDPVYSDIMNCMKGLLINKFLTMKKR